jgi:hypothetical protein
MCDSFLGEGGGRGLTNYAMASLVAKPLPAFALIPAHPSPRRDFKNFEHFRFETHRHPVKKNTNNGVAFGPRYSFQFLITRR